jgi:CheY-like chemotaxis protein
MLPRGTFPPCKLGAFRWSGPKTPRRCVSQQEMPGSQRLTSGFCWLEGGAALIALDLQALVENLGHKVVGVARTKAEALAIGRNNALGLILADIQLADGSSGLDAVNDLLNTFEVPVIFITAYPERFLTGKRPEPAFLVSKPYRPSALSAMVSQVLFFERNAIRRIG